MGIKFNAWPIIVATMAMAACSKPAGPKINATEVKVDMPKNHKFYLSEKGNPRFKTFDFKGVNMSCNNDQQEISEEARQNKITVMDRIEGHTIKNVRCDKSVSESIEMARNANLRISSEHLSDLKATVAYITIFNARNCYSVRMDLNSDNPKFKMEDDGSFTLKAMEVPFVKDVPGLLILQGGENALDIKYFGKCLHFEGAECMKENLLHRKQMLVISDVKYNFLGEKTRDICDKY